MRRILALTAALSLMGGLGCMHEVCDCCQDICGGCKYPGCGSRAVSVPAPMPAPAPVKTEAIKPAPKPVPDAPKGKEQTDAGKASEVQNLDE